MAKKALILVSSYILLLIAACSSTPQHSTQSTAVNVPIVSPTPPARKKIKPPKVTQPPNNNYMAQGKGSWYGINAHGAKMANGQLYDLYGMTAAHATLPFLSRVLVENKRTGNYVIVTITDRLGERESQRLLIKLSYWAARSIGLDKAFSEEVKIRGLRSKHSKSKNVTTVSQNVTTVSQNVTTVSQNVTTISRKSDIYLKVGSFSNPNDAYKLRNQLSNPFHSRVFVQQKANKYQVRIGPFANWNESDRASRILQKYGIRNVSVVPKTDH